MADDEDKVTTIPQGKNPADVVSNQIFEAAKKKRQEEFKKAMGEAITAGEVFTLACERAAAIQEELNNLTKVDFTEIKKALNL